MRSGYAHIMLGLVFACSSCHDVVVRDTPQNVFEVFWTTLDEHYVYFEEKGVDWDSMYVAYAPRARQVHTDAELLSLLHEMIVPLQDGHVSIVAGNTVVYSKRVRYSVENKEYYSPYLGALNSVRDTKSIWGESWDDGWDEVFWFVSGDYVLQCSPDGKRCHYEFANERSLILLLVLDDFREYDHSVALGYYKDVLGQYLQREFPILNHKKGIVLDLRANSGGYGENVSNFMSCFYTGEKDLYYTRFKEGAAHSIVGRELVTSEIGNGLVDENIPVVLLVDRYTYSAANLCAFIMADLPNVTLIGERTGGGGGSLRDVALPNGWVLCYTASKFYSMDDMDMELGIEPDIYVPYDEELEKKGDALFDRAVEYLDNL